MGLLWPRFLTPSFEYRVSQKTEVFKMNEEKSFVVYKDLIVPGPVTKAEHGKRYGSVAGLDDDELLGSAELERAVYQQEFGPILALPVKGSRSGIRPVVDEAGGVDFGAFGTVDFKRLLPEFDKARYKADKLREQLRDLAIRMAIVKERLPGRAKYLVLKYLKMGIIDLEHISSFDMLCLARLYLRARRLRDEICRLEKVSETRKMRQLERFLEVS
jgi:hypothetical protein